MNYKFVMAEKPIFLIPRSRTGGSLVATILGVHRDLSFGYEIFPDKLAKDEDTSLTVGQIIELLETHRADSDEVWIGNIPQSFFLVFCARTRRCGITLDELLGVFRDHAGPDLLLDSDDRRLDLIDEILQFQMHKYGKKRWGSKMNADLNLLYRRHPDARFLMMVRDGRDVLDSRLKVGNFQTNANETAHDWVDSIENFEGFLARSGAHGMLIKYEQLVEDPTSILTEILNLCELDFYPEIIHYEENDIHLLKAPHGHLSAKQIAEGLNSKSIGRHIGSLSVEDLATFESIAADTLARFGYL